MQREGQRVGQERLEEMGNTACLGYAAHYALCTSVHKFVHCLCMSSLQKEPLTMALLCELHICTPVYTSLPHLGPHSTAQIAVMIRVLVDKCTVYMALHTTSVTISLLKQQYQFCC